MGTEHRDAMEIDLQKLLIAFLHKWYVILICTLLAGLAAFYITANLITPMYKADVTVYVNNVRSGLEVESISSTNLSTSQKLVNTYINIIESDTVLEKVAEASEMDINAAEIRSVMTAEQVDDTELFTVSITHPSPILAAQLANAVAEVAPGEIESFVEGSSTKIIDYAKVPTSPDSPSVSRNTILGALVGCVIAVLYLTIRFLLDVRIKEEDDLTMLFDLPVLAQIPSFVHENSKRRGYGYESSAAQTQNGGQS